MNKTIDFKLTKQNLFLIFWCILNLCLLAMNHDYIFGDFNDFTSDIQHFCFYSNWSYYDWSELIIYVSVGFIIYAVFDKDKVNVAKTIKSIILYFILCIVILYFVNFIRSDEYHSIEYSYSGGYSNYSIFGMDVNREIYDISKYAEIFLVFVSYPLFKGIKWISVQSDN